MKAAFLQRNLLENPDYYMYSALQGAGFIAAYIDVIQSLEADLRHDWMQAIEGMEQGDLRDQIGQYGFLKEVLGEDFRDLSIHTIAVSDQDIEPRGDKYSSDGRAHYDTFELLVWLLRESTMQTRAGSEVELLVSKLLLKIEVFRKLYACYSTSTFRKAGNELVRPEAYPLFGLLLWISHGVTGKLPYFNCALKVSEIAFSIYKTSERVTIEFKLLLLLLARIECRTLRSFSDFQNS